MYKRTFKAFTLPEILISLSVIIILSAILLPSLAGARQRAARAAAVKTIATLREKSEVLVTGGSDTKIYQSGLCTSGFNQELLSVNNRLGYGEGKLSTSVADSVSTTNVSINNSTSCFEKTDGTAWFVVTDVNQKDDEKELFCTDYTGFAGIIQEGYSLEDWQCDADNDALSFGVGTGYSQNNGGTLCTGPNCTGIISSCIPNPLFPDKCKCKNPDPVTGKCPIDTCPKFDDPTTPWKENDCDCDKDGILNDDDKCDSCDKDGSIGDVCVGTFKSGFTRYVRAGLVVNSDGTIVGAEMMENDPYSIRLRKANKDGSINALFDQNFYAAFPNGITNDLYFGTGLVRLSNSTASNGKYVFPSGHSKIYSFNDDGTRYTALSDAIGTLSGGPIHGIIQLPSDGGNDFVVYGGIKNVNQGGNEYPVAEGLARFNSDGSLEKTYDYKTDAGGEVIAATVDADGKLTVFTKSGATTNGARRFLANGNQDTSFSFSVPENIGLVRTATLDSNGNYYLGNGDNENSLGIIKLNPNGSINTEFKSNIGVGLKGQSQGTSIAVQSNGKVVMGGQFTKFNGTAANGLIRLNSNGTIDTSFINNYGTGIEGALTFSDGTDKAFIRVVKLDSDDNIVVSGQFKTISEQDSPWVARVTKDGQVYTAK